MFSFQRLEMLIVSLLEACKTAFKDVCPNFKFFKFHTIVHCPLQARWFGNIDVMDANRFFWHYFVENIS